MAAISADQGLDILAGQWRLDHRDVHEAVRQDHLYCEDRAGKVVASWCVHRHDAHWVEAERLKEARLHYGP